MSGPSRTRDSSAVAGPALVLGAGVSVQVGAAVAVRLFDRIGPLSTVWLRLAFGAVMLLVLARLRRRGRAPAFDLRVVLLFGAVVAAMNTCFYQAIDRLPLGVAVTIEFLGPLAVAAAASRRRLDLLWIGLAAVGVAALSSPSADIDAVGALLALAAGGGWAAFILVGRRLGSSGSLVDGLSLALVVGAVLLTPAGILGREGSLASARSLALGAAVALLSSALPWLLELSALRLVPLTAYGVLVSLEPAVAAVVGALALSQHLGAAEIAAVAAVVTASVGSSLTTTPPPAPPG
jgi:inner membrane transporter RhtA